MAKTESKTWSLTEKLIVAVAATLILAILWWFWGLITYFFTISIPSFFVWLNSPISISHWHYLSLLGVFMVAVLYASVRIITCFRASKSVEPSMHDFTEMPRFGFLWRWRWIGTNIEYIVCHCPECTRIMRHCEEERYIGGIRLYCQNCTAVKDNYPGTYNELVRDVKVEIHHALDTGSWRQYLPTPAK